MKKKEFKMQLATNPILYQWVKENQMWLKNKPETLLYLMQHPDGLRYFKPGQSVDNEKIARNAHLFMSQMIQERNQKKEKKKAEPKEKKEPSTTKKKGLFDGLKNMFPQFAPPAVLPTQMKFPTLKPPARFMPGSRQAGNALPAAKPTKQQLRLPKIKVNRRKMMDTLSQTTEMLDVVAALMGKISNIK
ncbi:hypothetical protein [Ammoniphilus resinae]|uniref:Uncharacterized protein n=1 Tax=Ammoniphilus resinae TaxID=861532 RepID=A0ABS4GT56_9BACL|nr:hypothetical protein [Ammoniphilus resinae]MBP1933434.1 hypothetical protein [Ammoniphilus resinae]